MLKNGIPGERLQICLDNATIFVDRGEYIGRTKDGTEVNVGTVGYESSVECYLSKYPDPSFW